MSIKVIFAGKDCEDCIHANIDESNKAKVICQCDVRPGKYYVWGQCISCDDKEKVLSN